MHTRTLLLIALTLALAAATAPRATRPAPLTGGGPHVYTSYHWHLQQPIYWPAPDPNLAYPVYQKAYDSMNLQQQQGGHPETNLASVFGKPDRQAVYQERVADAIDAASQHYDDMGAQVSYSGCLIENVNSFAEHGSTGYAQGWNKRYATMTNLEKTSGGQPKLDLVAFGYHHVIAPLVDKNLLRKEIQLHKLIYAKTWNNAPYSKGFFPAEMSFSERIIDVLVEEGIEWSIVSNNHISRSCANYTYSVTGDNNNPPNRADTQNPAQSAWFRESVSRGCTPNNAVPFSYTPHYAQHVDPASGKTSRIVVVPAAQAMSWQDGYECYSTNDIDSIADKCDDADHPCMFLFAHDGDNAFGGGYSYYLQCTPDFVQQAASKGYHPTTIQQYLHRHPVDTNDVVHVEDGAWINADSDFGAPRFINWNWPLLNDSGSFDVPGGWAMRERNWAVITAAQNRVETAEQLAGGVDLAQVQAPGASTTPAELAWHFFLPAATSGYMYYGNAQDLEQKPAVACNHATHYADKVVNASTPAADTTAPSVWFPMRLPYNPGGCGAGALWKYKYTPMPTDFYVYTFVYDVSGLANVTLYVREDADGVNPLNDHANEVFEPARLGLSGVGAWEALPMKARAFPANHTGVTFLVEPSYIADEYYAQVTGKSGVLLDYYISAVDTQGNVKNSDIFHVYVGTGDACKQE